MDGERVAGKSLLAFIKRLASSKLGQILALVHLILVVYALADRGSSTFHFHYESILLKILFILDLPVLIFFSVIAFPFKSQTTYLAAFWWGYLIGGALMLFCASIQWWLIGYWLERLIRDKTFKSDVGI